MELRKDYLLERWVIIASGRGKRPQELSEQKAQKDQKCFFCPGSEDLTPPEIGRIGSAKEWKFRWFPNKFPAAELSGNSEVRTDNSFFTFADAYGSHEVIVETPSSREQLWDLSKSELKELLAIYSSRINALSSMEKISYVTIFKNHGSKGGASLQHSHTQVVATSILPPVVRQEMDAVKSQSHCPYCSIMGIERNSFRRCFENNSAIAFTPYASRFNYEIWVFPKRHVRSLNELSEPELSDFAEILDRILKKLKLLDVSYNYFLHYAPKDSDLHLHLEVTPRIANWAGFELSSGIVINTTSPEDAAKFYRGEAEF